MTRALSSLVVVALAVGVAYYLWGRVVRHDLQVAQRDGMVALVFREATIVFEDLPVRGQSAARGSLVVAGWGGDHETNLTTTSVAVRYAYLGGGVGSLVVGSYELELRDRGRTLAGKGWSFPVDTGKKTILVTANGSARVVGP